MRGSPGSRFRLVTEPAHGQLVGTVIAAPAFAEEMNKSRRMSARMARLLAEHGWRVVQRDLFGCGDSSGDFGDATWSAWLTDLDDELAMAQASLPVWLWGLRAGVLLATGVLARRLDSNLLLWQPVTSGAQHLQQFLRLHAGARIVGSGKAEGQSSPAQRLRAGQSAEVGGYELNPLLASGMEQASFELPAGFSGRVVWFEVSDDATRLTPAATRPIERLRARQIGVEAEAICGHPFWQTQEIEENEVLLQRSLAVIDGPRLPAASAEAAGRTPA